MNSNNCDKKKKIGIVTIISIIVLALAVIATVGIIFYCLIGMDGASTESSQGYTWFLIIGSTIGALIIGYYAVLMVVSLICDLKLNKKRSKDVIVSIGLVLPVLFFLLTIAFAFLIEGRKSYNMADLKVEFPEGMNRSGVRREFNGSYSSLEFFAREESNATCSISVSYNKIKSDRPAYENMIENSNDIYIDKDTKTNDYITNNYYKLNSKNINGTKWDYLEYNSTTTYYKIYGTSYKNNYYTFEIKDTHTSHSMCKQKESEFINKLKFKN